MRRRVSIAAWVAVACLVALPLQARDAVRPPAAAVASAHPDATAAGIGILEAGGNAFDAAVAVSAALAVVEPSGSGLGGGGFWLLHRGVDGFEIMVDGRERAPLAAHADMYLDSQGEYQQDWSRNGPLAAGIPGLPAALVHLSDNYGRLPLAETLAPAIRLAREGFRVDDRLLRLLRFRRAVVERSTAASAILLPGGRMPREGDLLRQQDLADTLTSLAAHGHGGFYAGTVADALVAGVRDAGGIWTDRDLASYEVIERKPIDFTYRGWRVVSASPPSSGGIVMAEAMQILEPMPLETMDEAARSHVVIESWRQAYRDRAQWLGDPDHVDMPVDMLTSKRYAEQRRRRISMQRAAVSEPLPQPGIKPDDEGRNTTHLSVVDGAGNMVSATLSINFPFGSGFVAPGTGVFLNNEMDDFSSQPGVPNGYGLVGSTANAIAPGKRMLSSMSPTIAFGPDRIAMIGTPGGSRIISMVMLGLLDVIAGRDAREIVSAPRYHHQYLPDEVQHEPGALTEAVSEALLARGHRLKNVGRDYGNMQLIIWERLAQRLDAASDPRGIGSAEILRSPPAAPPRNDVHQRWQRGQ